MYWKIKKSSAMMTTELAISISLVVVALFITLGLFSDNLKDMVTSGNFQRFFMGSDKTTYSAFNRDYSNSAIESIMTGEQGLEQIRKLANNMGIELIEKRINKTDTSEESANSIEYLALIIDAITGEPHMCVHMKKDTTKHCNDTEIGGYKYAVSSGLTTVRALNTSNSAAYPGSSTATNYNTYIPAITLTGVDSSLSSLASLITTSGGNSTMSTSEKTAFVKTATKTAQPVAYKSVLLANVNNKYTSNDKDEYTTTQFASDLANTAYDVYLASGASIVYCGDNSNSCSTKISTNDMAVVELWKNNVSTMASTITSDDTFSSISNKFLTSMLSGQNEATNGIVDWAINMFVTSPNIIDIINDDTISTGSKQTACHALLYGSNESSSLESETTNGLVNITKKHSEITLHMLGITTGIHQYVMTVEGYPCSAVKE